MAVVTVVIPNYKGIKFIEECLASLYDQVEGTPEYEVLVVDNASDDGSVELIREKFPQTRLICLDSNTGFCHAVNVGIQNSKSPFVFLLNNDTKVYPDVIKNLYQTINRSKKIFSVSAAMLTWDKPEILDDAGDFYTIMGWALARGKGKPYAAYQKRVKIFSACGGAALYRRTVFDKIGLFDENHFAYLEDLDVGYRARIYGFENMYEPSARVIHYGSASTGSRYNEWKTKRAAANNVYVIAKNQPVAFKILHFPFLLAGFCIKQVFFIRKGMGKQYFLGVLDGIRLSTSAEGRKHKVPYKKENLRNYLKIELKMIGALIMK